MYISPIVENVNRYRKTPIRIFAKSRKWMSVVQLSTPDAAASANSSNVQNSKLQKVIDIFPSFESEGLCFTRLIKYNIDISTAKPIKQRFCLLSPAKEKLLSVDIDRMIKINVIEEAASSPWTSQVTFNYMQLPIRMLFRFL